MKKPGNLPGFFCLGVYEGRKLEVRSLKQGIIRITYETRSIQINRTDMEIIVILLIGGAAGWLGSLIYKGSGMGIAEACKGRWEG